MAVAKGERPAIIFDFDGTIADNMLLTLGIMYQTVHHQPMPIEDMSRLRGMTLLQMLRELKIPYWKAFVLTGFVRKALSAHISEVALIPGMDEAIRQLARSSQLYVLSSNSEQNVRNFLERFGMAKYFVAIYSDANPVRKQGALRRLVREHRLAKKMTWYVGDQGWDIRAAHKAGVRSLAVAWGFSNIHVLRRRQPDALLFSPDELVYYFSVEKEIDG